MNTGNTFDEQRREGSTAFWSGYDLIDRPYPAGTNECDAWYEGWRDAARQSRRWLQEEIAELNSILGPD